MEQASFTEAELAARARVAPELVGRLVELAILRPGDAAAPYGLGDVRRVRLVEACAQAGLPLEGIGAAIAGGRLSLAFLDLLSIAGRPLTDTTYAQLCDEQGLSMELVRRVHEASGLGRPQADDPIHPLDRDLLGSAQLGRMLGLDDGVLIRIARVYGENLRRIAQAEPEFYHDHVEGPLLASGMDERQMRETASQLSDQLAGVVQRMLAALYTRHQERYTIDHLVEHIEAVVTERRPQRPPSPGSPRSAATGPPPPWPPAWPTWSSRCRSPTAASRSSGSATGSCSTSGAQARRWWRPWRWSSGPRRPACPRPMSACTPGRWCSRTATTSAAR
jgi:Adenylate cyclase regulatory domain